MSGKAGAYGTSGGGDTDFRKTWDRDEMAQRAKDREAKDREEGKERYEAKLAGKTYRRRASTPDDLKQTEARSERIDWSKMIGKQTLTSAAAAVGKRGRGAGAYCQACDLTFKYVFIVALSQSMNYSNRFQRQYTVRRASQQQAAFSRNGPVGRSPPRDSSRSTGTPTISQAETGRGQVPGGDGPGCAIGHDQGATGEECRGEETLA
jgi:hypothetical protein